MKTLSISWTMKKIIRNIEKNNILVNHPMQRKSEQWTIDQKSLFIHSILAGYPIPPLYIIKDEEKNDRYSVLDGKQRSTTGDSFSKDEFALSDVPIVIVDEVEYEISGLKFSELPEELKDEFYDANLLMYIFEDCSDDEIEEIFYRLNNGTALTKDQKTRARLGVDLIKYVDEILNLDFFKKKANFTNYQLKRAEDQTCVLQTLMLITNYNFSKFGNSETEKFATEFRRNCKQEDLDLCKNLFIKLNEAFDKKNKLLKKIHIPMFAVTLKSSQEMDVSFNKFKEWINNFINNYDASSEYGKCCSTHTTNKEVVHKRIDLMLNSLVDYVS